MRFHISKDFLVAFQKRQYFFIPPTLKGRYASHTHVCRRYLWHTQYANITHVQHLVPMQFEPQMADIQASPLQVVQFAKLPIILGI